MIPLDVVLLTSATVKKQGRFPANRTITAKPSANFGALSRGGMT